MGTGAELPAVRFCYSHTYFSSIWPSPVSFKDLVHLISQWDHRQWTGFPQNALLYQSSTSATGGNFILKVLKQSLNPRCQGQRPLIISSQICRYGAAHQDVYRQKISAWCNIGVNAWISYSRSVSKANGKLQPPIVHDSSKPLRACWELQSPNIHSGEKREKHSLVWYLRVDVYLAHLKR